MSRLATDNKVTWKDWEVETGSRDDLVYAQRMMDAGFLIQKGLFLHLKQFLS